MKRLLANARIVADALDAAAKWPKIEFDVSGTAQGQGKVHELLKGISESERILRVAIPRIASELLIHSNSLATRLRTSCDRALQTLVEVDAFLREWYGISEFSHWFAESEQLEQAFEFVRAAEAIPTEFESLRLGHDDSWLTPKLSFQLSVLQAQSLTSEKQRVWWDGVRAALRSATVHLETPTETTRSATNPFLGLRRLTVGTSASIVAARIPASGTMCFFELTQATGSSIEQWRADVSNILTPPLRDAINLLPGGPDWVIDLQNEAEIDRLISQWELETQLLSSHTRMMKHEAIEQIIHRGRDAVGPIIRHLLRAGPSWIILALPSLTGQNPTAPEHRGKIELLCNDWTHWWESQSETSC